ncbi:MAG: zinc ribbon domain-containing protein [Anaerolineae bacterium]|nr:zinc ribbon domain-containing protein [Anaerolineae bacterium]
MPSPAPVDTAAERLTVVRTDWQRVAGTLALTALFDSLENVSHSLDTLSGDLSDVRARGYRFGRNWETQLGNLLNQWPGQRSQAMAFLEDEQRALQRAASDVEMLLNRAGRDTGLISTAESRIRAVQSSVSSAEHRVRGTYDTTQSQASALRAEVARASFLLDALDTASFDLLPDEHGVAACEATWTSDQQEPQGYLFLTDARLLFEQREEVATKKVLFITTQKELIQEKLWESPIGAVEELEAEDKKGFLSRKEMLTLRFSERTREIPSDVTLQLKGSDNDTWRSLIRQVKSGQIDSDRFGAPAPEELLTEEVTQEAAAPEKELPTVCPNCNAPLPPVFKGMRQVTCDYCGTVINL